MIRPIIAYGDPVLRKETEEITKDFPDFKLLLSDMYETMYDAQGVGLAAPQIGKALRLFIVDATPFSDDDPTLEGFKKTFVNPVIVDESGDPWKFNEGCLSIPGVREDVERLPDIQIEYYDEDFNFHSEKYSGTIARIIQHEYDHIEGVLFTDLIHPVKKQLIKKRLNNIAKGQVKVDYRMRFPLLKGKH